MLLNKFLTKMQKSSRNFITSCFPRANFDNLHADYENAIKALNNLQSNADYIKIARQEKLSHPEEFSKTILQTQKYLIRSGITLESLDKLSVIHVAGTKGKGTTCALCESILRHHGLRTGFYSSPHLLEVRERIRINGVPLQKQEFAKHFWYIYNKLNNEKTHSDDMPMYFKFLTIMAFRVFLMEKVDVAIIEVGIGGEYDSTNILRNVPIVGITSLGLDHTSILGDTLEQIAWHKSGIIKSGCQAYTVPQNSKAMKIIEDRSADLNSTLKVVTPFLSSSLLKNSNGPRDIFNLNASLAVTLAQAWLNLKDESSMDLTNSEATKLGLLKCKWSGRYMIVNDSNMYYLDGAHTPESIEVCAQWFLNETQNSEYKKILIFNATGDRDSQDLLKKLRVCCFDKVYFVPNKAVKNDAEDNKNYTISNNKQVERCYTHREVWLELENTCNTYRKVSLAKVLSSVSEALLECSYDKYNVLITGSLHLVGAALSIIDPQLNMPKNNTS